MTRRFALLAAAMFTLVIGLTAAPAWAHHAIVSGSQSCTNGDHQVSWSIGNSETVQAMTIVSAAAQAGVTAVAVTGYTNPIAGNGSTAAASTVPGVLGGSVTITVHGLWPDGITSTVTATVPLGDPCVPSMTTTTGAPTTTTVPDTSTTIPATTTIGPPTSSTTLPPVSSSTTTVPPCRDCTTTTTRPPNVTTTTIRHLPHTGTDASGHAVGGALAVLAGTALAFAGGRRRRT